MSADDKYIAEKKAELAAAERQRQVLESQSIRNWDNAMQRVFKGIVSRPIRHSFLRSAQRRMERTGTFARPARQDPNNPKGGIHTREDNPRKRRGPGGGGKRKGGKR